MPTLKISHVTARRTVTALQIPSGSWYVRHLRVRNGDEIVWDSRADSALYFQFPKGLFKGPWKITEKLSKGVGHKLKKTISGLRGCYNYSVFIDKDKAFAIGGSPPTIIIE